MPTLRYTNTVLTALAVLLGLNLWAQATGDAGAALAPVRTAQAAPERDNPSVNYAQRRDQLQLSEFRGMNEKLAALQQSVNAMQQKLNAGVAVDVRTMPAPPAP